MSQCNYFKLATSAMLALVFSHAALADKPTLTVYTYDSFAAEWGIPTLQLNAVLNNNVAAN